MTTHIYHLVDPNTRLVRYVGKSASPKSRLRAHIQESRERQNTQKKTWIHGLLSAGQEPILVIVSSHPDDASARIIESRECHAHRETIFNIHDPAKGAADFHKQKPDSQPKKEWGKE